MIQMPGPPDKHVINSGAFSNIVDACVPDIAGLTLDTATAATLTVDSSRVFGISSGGILVSPNVGANNSVITGGALTSSLANNALIIHQNNTAGTLEIASDRAGGDLVKSGAGTLILSGSSLVSTGRSWNEGRLVLTGGNAVGNTAFVNIQGATGSGATVLELAAAQSKTIGLLQGGERQRHRFDQRRIHSHH